MAIVSCLPGQLLFLLFNASLILMTGAVPTDTPNFVVFFADDFGWGDLHTYGHPTQERGRIDEMAEQGIRFTQWYSGESLCTPSRMAIMTGRMPTRMGMQHTVFSPGGSQALPLNETTIAEELRPLGYVTGMAGKWHLGINQNDDSDGLHLPFYRGFDNVGRILPFSNHWACDESGRHETHPLNSTCFLYHNTTIVQQPIDHRNLTATIVSDAVSFIATNAQKQQKFFYYLAFPQCHVSMFTGTNWSNTSVNGIFGDQIREMDWAVGRVLDALVDNGVDKNTLVLFSSDHGPHVELCNEGGTTGYLRGGKGDSSWEGGVRVPGIAYWPGVTVAQVSDEIVSTMDIFATLLELAGGGTPTNKIIDGKSLVPILKGTNSSSPHEALFHYCGSNLMAVRVGDFKLRYYTEQLPLDNYSTQHCTAGWAHGEFFQGGWDCKGGSVTTNTIPELFHITSDPSERFPLLDNSTWMSHMRWAWATGSLPPLEYYDEIGLNFDVLRRGDQHHQQDQHQHQHQHQHRLDDDFKTKDTCGDNVTFANHTSFSGYSGTALGGSTLDEMIKICLQRCCNDSECAAAVVQPYSENTGEPMGSCEKKFPCCWLVDSAASSGAGQPSPNCTTVFTRPSPGPYNPTGPYADVMRKIDAIVAKHLASMTRGSIPHGSSKNINPCCHDPMHPGACTCNYPSQHIP